MEDIKKIMEILNELELSDFTGFIRISFKRGGITQVEKFEELYKRGSKTLKI